MALYDRLLACCGLSAGCYCTNMAQSATDTDSLLTLNGNQTLTTWNRIGTEGV